MAHDPAKPPGHRPPADSTPAPSSPAGATGAGPARRPSRAGESAASAAGGAAPATFRRTFRDSLFVKLCGVLLIVLVLWIPLQLVRGLVSERETRQAEAARQMASRWGEVQVVGGPVLVVPYRIPARPGDREGRGARAESWQDAYFLPEDLTVRAELVPEVRRLGIFETVLYAAEVTVTGSFAPPDLSGWPVEAADLAWERASLRVAVRDLAGLRAARVTWDGRELPVAPGRAVPGLWQAGLESTVGRNPGGAATAAAGGRPHSFDLRLTLLGSRGFHLLPLGRSSHVELTSSWPDPGFAGGFLPESREVGPDGFSATWTVPDLAQGRPGRWRAGDLPTEGRAPALSVVPLPANDPGDRRPEAIAGSDLFPSLGVTLTRPVDHYRKSERSVKYGLLFVVLTFAAVFLLEVVGRVPLHPMHYLLVGGALVVFYLLLLSLSEHVPFAVAYLAASTAVVGLVTAYAAAILGGPRRALVLGGVLALLYAYLWSLLTAGDYALLFGSVGLFTVLAAVMYLTRRVDWWRPADPGVC